MKYILFTTTSCPKCPALKRFVEDNISFDGEELDNTDSDFLDRAKELKIEAAPTLVIFKGDKEIFRGNEIQEVREFLKEQTA